MGYSDKSSFMLEGASGTSASRKTGSQQVSELLNKQPVQVAQTSYVGRLEYGAGPGTRLIPANNPQGKRWFSQAEASDAMAEAYGLGTQSQKNSFRKLGLFPDGARVDNLPNGSFLTVAITPELHSGLQQAAATIKANAQAAAEQASAAAQRQESAATVVKAANQRLQGGGFSADREKLWTGLVDQGVSASQSQALVARNDANVLKFLRSAGEGLASGGHYDNLSSMMPELVKSKYLTQDSAQKMLDRNWLNWARNSLQSGSQNAPSRQDINNRGFEIISRVDEKDKKWVQTEIESLKQLADQKSGKTASTPVNNNAATRPQPSASTAAPSTLPVENFNRPTVDTSLSRTSGGQVTANAPAGQPAGGEPPKSRIDSLAESWVNTVQGAHHEAKVLRQSDNPLERAVGTFSDTTLNIANGVNDTVRNAREFYAEGSKSDNFFVRNTFRVGGVLTELGAGAASVVTFGASNQTPEQAVQNTVGAGLTAVTIGAGPAISAVANSPVGKTVTTWGDDAARGVLNSPVGRFVAGKVDEVTTGVGNSQLGQALTQQGAEFLQNLSRINQFPNEVLKKVPLPGGSNLAQGLDEVGNTINRLNNFGRTPPGTQADAVVNAADNTAQQRIASPAGSVSGPRQMAVPKDVIGANPSPNASTTYHGTHRDAAMSIVDNGFDPNTGRPNGDFGGRPIFYTTTDPKQAAEWAARRNGDQGVVLEFTTARNDLATANAARFSMGGGEDWEKFVRTNRLNTSGERLHPFEVAEGPMLLNPDSWLAGGKLKIGGQQLGVDVEKASGLLQPSNIHPAQDVLRQTVGRADDIMKMDPQKVVNDPQLFRRLVEELDRTSGEQGRTFTHILKDKFPGIEVSIAPMRTDPEALRREILKRTDWKGISSLDSFSDLARGRIDVRSVKEAKEVVELINQQFPGRVLLQKDPSPGYPRYHLRLDNGSGVPTELQVGPRAATELFESKTIQLPDSLKPYFKPGGGKQNNDFHDVRFGLLSQVKDPAIIEKSGLAAFDQKYNQLVSDIYHMDGAYPPNFQQRKAQLSRELAEVLDYITKQRPGVLEEIGRRRQ
jgi:hypothetical protein